MITPRSIDPTTVYTAEEARELLRVGEAKLREAVEAEHLISLDYHRHFLFFGEELIRFCREASGLPLGGLS